MSIVSSINYSIHYEREKPRIVKANEDDATRRQIEAMKRGNRRGR